MNWIQMLLVVGLSVLFQYLMLIGIYELLPRKGGDSSYFWGMMLFVMVIPTTITLIIIALLQKIMWKQTFYKALTIDIGVAFIPIVILSLMVFFKK